MQAIIIVVDIQSYINFTIQEYFLSLTGIYSACDTYNYRKCHEMGKIINSICGCGLDTAGHLNFTHKLVLYFAIHCSSYSSYNMGTRNNNE